MGVSLAHCWRKPDAEPALKVCFWLWVLPWPSYCQSEKNHMWYTAIFLLRAEEGVWVLAVVPGTWSKTFLSLEWANNAVCMAQETWLWGGVALEMMGCRAGYLWASSKGKVLIHLPFQFWASLCAVYLGERTWPGMGVWVSGRGARGGKMLKNASQSASNNNLSKTGVEHFCVSTSQHL